jgi:hypothetical protein
LRALARIVNETPCAVDPVLDPVAERVTENPLPARQNAVRILQRRASGDPEAVVPHVSRLVDAVVSTEGMNTGRVDLPDYKQSELEDQSMAEERLRQRTASVLQELASARPEAVAPALPRLLAPVDPARARNVHLKEQLLDVARTVTATASDAALERIDTLYAVVEDDDAPQALRANAAGTLAAVADSHIEAVTVPGESAIPALGDLLAADDPAVRANAGSLLSYVAQQYPSATASLTDTLVGRLDDENVAVRSSVVWTLAYVDTEPAREALRRVADEDPNPDVRGLATELLTSGPGA